MKISINQFLPFLFIISTFSQVYSQQKSAGKARKDSIQQIPGKIQCEIYDRGGEGVVYHDKDSINNGIRRLNPAAGSFLNEFRINDEGVCLLSVAKLEPIENLKTLHQKKGIHLLTLRTILNVNMNYNYLDFRLEK